MPDQRVCQLAFFGRAVDALTGRVVGAPDLAVSVAGEDPPVSYKPDGYFAIADLAPRPTDYEIALQGSAYRTKRVRKPLPTSDPVALKFDGEDELIVHCTAATANQLTFAKVGYLPLIKKTSAIVGEGGATSVLDADASGTDVTFVRTTIGATMNNKVVRVVRSDALVLRPGPYYEFPAQTTVIALKVVVDTIESPPVEDATITMTHVDGNTITSVAVGSVSVRKAKLAAMTANNHVLGTQEDVEVLTNARGDALFHFPPGVPIASVKVSVVATGFVTAAVTVAATTGKRVFKEVRLLPS